MSDFSGEWRAWHDAREQRLRDPQGWLAITAIHWLSDRPERFDDVPGTWTGDADGATVTLVDAESLTTETARLTKGVHHLGPLDGVGLAVAFDGAVAQVADRDGRVIVRPRHPDSPNLRAYAGTPCYPPDPSWLVAARFVPHPEPTDDAVGEVVFDHAGAEHRLVAWDDDDGLWILFRDATSGVTTYAASRQLVTPGAVTGGGGLDRLQPGPQHAVRVHRLRDLPATPGWQHAAVRGRGGGEGPRPTGVTPIAAEARTGGPPSHPTLDGRGQPSLKGSRSSPVSSTYTDSVSRYSSTAASPFSRPTPDFPNPPKGMSGATTR